MGLISYIKIFNVEIFINGLDNVYKLIRLLGGLRELGLSTLLLLTIPEMCPILKSSASD